MSQENNSQQYIFRTRRPTRHRITAADGALDSPQAHAGKSHYPASLVSDPRSRASHNHAVLSTVIREAQQTYGNNALQPSQAGDIGASFRQRAVQRWEATRQARQSSPHPVAIQRTALLNLQRKAIKDGDAEVGQYDALAGLESSYQSKWEKEKKSVGVSYHMSNAEKTDGTKLPRAVAHAHVTGNGQNIAGISVKSSPGGGGAQWVSPHSIHPATRAEILSDMQAQTPNPFEVTNIRKVSMVTGTWNAPHDPVPTVSKLNETIYIAEPGGFVSPKTISVALIYDINTGKYKRGDMFATEDEAQKAANKMPMPAPTPKAAPVKPAPAKVEPAPIGPTEAELKKRAKNAAKRQRQKEAARASKSRPSAETETEEAEGGEEVEETTATTPAVSEQTAGLWAWLTWAAAKVGLASE